MTSQPRVCPVCGTPPPSDAPEGFCPRCSFGGALKLEPGEELITTKRLEPSADNPPLTTRRAAPLAGISLGDYELLEEIAEGGMGIVYKARQRSLDRIVAVKTLLFGPQAKPEFIKRFHAEAAAAASLQHPNIVAIHEVGVQEGQHYFVMDYVEGQTLAELVSKTPLPAKRAAGYVKQIAEAIHYAHERGILHRDLKPSNVLIDAQDQPRVTDFGLAKRFEGESELTLSGQVVGSPCYLPPEQAEAKRGKVSRRSDVYGLGAILYHLLTGRPPFQAETLTELLRQVVEREPVSPRLLNPSIARDLETICLKCLEKEPARRYATAQTVAEELGRFLADEPVMARPIGAAGKAWRWCRRKPVLAGLGTAVLILLLVVAVGSPLALVRINRARLAALAQTRRAEDQTRLAQAQELKARQHEYVADMNLAQHALAMSNLGRARRLLEKYHPTNSTLSTLNAQRSTDLRGWEWRYLWSLCQSDALFTFSQNPSPIGAVAFAGNGRLLAARDEPAGNVIVFDIATRQEIARLPDNASQLRAMAVSPDGNLLAHGTGAEDGGRIVELWDVRTRHRVGELPHPERFVSLAFSPDGKRLATFGADRTARVWSLETAKVSATFPLSPVTGDHKGVVAFSPDGGTLAIGEADGRIRLITLASGTERANYQAHPRGEGITALAFSADSQIVASGSGYSDGTVRLWDARTGQSVGQLAGHTTWIVCLVLSPDGHTLASASADQTIRLWDLALKQCRVTLRGHTTEVLALTFSPDGKSLVSGCKDGAICFWNPNAGPKPALALTLPVAVRRLVFSPDNQTFHTLNLDGSISLWDAATAQKTATHAGLGTNNTSLAVSPDGNLLLAGTATGAIKVWNRVTQRELTNFTAHAAQIEHLLYRLEGRILVSAARDSAVKLWDATSWREQRVCRTEHDFWVFDASADARVAAAAGGTTVDVWDLATRKQVTSLAGDLGWVDGVAFSHDGRLLATASQHGSAILYELGTWREVARLRGVLRGVHSVAFAPDGRRLVTGGMTEEAVKLWDLATLQELVTFQAEGTWGSLWTAISPDGSTLVGVSQEGTAHLWRAPSLREIDARSVERSR